MEETRDFNDVEIFSTGKWEGKGSQPGGDVIDEGYLNKIVDTFNKVGDKVKPAMRVTHDGQKSEGITGAASVGWVTGLRTKKEGLTTKLLADLKSVPKKIGTLIDNKAIGRFSPSIWTNMNIGGANYENVMAHLAILGTDLPANMDLDGFIDLYYENDSGQNLISYISKKEEIIMSDDNKKIDELEKRLAEFEKTSEENAELQEKIKNFEKEEIAFNEKLKEFAKTQAVSYAKEVESYIDKAIDERKILPSQKHILMSLASVSDQREYAYNDDGTEKKIEGSSFEIIKQFVDNQPSMEDGMMTAKAEVEPVLEDSNDSDRLDKKIKSYMKENNVKYDEAFDSIAYGEE